jgi:hypothetical protein
LNDLWRALADEISTSAQEIFPDPMPRQNEAEYFISHVRNWLEMAGERRILLLLDESDLFLEADGGKEDFGNAFYRCAQLKGLMDDTNRRFKVVFAGLHNVQRSTHIANNPLAHYGTPICIGPLLENGESREAQALVETPLASIGLFFETTDLVIRILAQTNYYPNLIQIYCYNLINHITERQRVLADSDAPPYLITSDDINEVYERRQLRDDLQHRFRLTLDLDPRFRLIAYILALYNEDSAQGFDVDWIRTSALDFWDSGFVEIRGKTESNTRYMTHDSFCNLLDEMVGLGILRVTPGSGLYKLRSPNVVSLLGNRQQVEMVLEDSPTWEPPVQYAPDTFRSLLDPDNKTVRSPLTAAQESVLRNNENGVFVILGSGATGLYDLKRSLENQFSPEFIHELVEIRDLADLGSQLTNIGKKRQHGKTLAFISHTESWNTKWLQHGLKRLDRYNKPNAYLGIVFVCDPEKYWKLGDCWSSYPTIKCITLHPWRDEAVRQWFTDSHMGPQDENTRMLVYNATGNWPILLRKMADECKDIHISEKLLKTMSTNWYNDSQQKKELMLNFGLETAGPIPILRTLAQYGDATTEEELNILVESQGLSVDTDYVRRVITWADGLNLATQQGNGWILDKCVTKYFGE